MALRQGDKETGTHALVTSTASKELTPRSRIDLCTPELQQDVSSSYEKINMIKTNCCLSPCHLFVHQSSNSIKGFNNRKLRMVFIKAFLPCCVPLSAVYFSLRGQKRH